MVLACEIEYRDDGRREFVLFPYGLYFLPGGRLADATFALAWCESCDALRAAESFESPSDLQARIAAFESGQIPFEYGYLDPSRTDELQRLLDGWRTTLAYVQFRTAPSRCVECGGTRVHALDQRAEILSVGGREFGVSYVLASTSIDHRLTILSADGLALGEISRYDADGVRIDHAYPYSGLMRILTDAKIELTGEA